MNVEMAKIIIASLSKCSANKNNVWKILRRLTASGRMYFAKVSTSCPEILEVLASDKNLFVREAVALNESTSTCILKRLASDMPVVRAAVALNKSTTSDILKTLVNDMDENVRRHVASNENTTAETLDFLSRDRDILVVVSVASNPHTREDTLSFLAHVPNLGVRCAVARNPSATKDILLYLKHDFYGTVRGVAVQKIEERYF